MRETLFFPAKSAMTSKIFFFAWFAVAFAEGSSDRSFSDFGYSDFDALQNLTESARKNVLEAFDKISITSKEFDEYVQERLSCLMWECTVQKQNLNKTITKAVTKGMSKNFQFIRLQCISNAAQETFKKLDELKALTSLNSQKIHAKGLEEIIQFKTTFEGFFGYIQELHKTKKEELEKAINEGARKRILEEVIKKLKFMNSILEQIINNAKTIKFKFMEKYINFAFGSENDFKYTQRKGANKIMKCVS